MLHQDARLCPNCPLDKKFKEIAKGRLFVKQLTTIKEEPSALKVCMERRKLIRQLRLERTCKYFSEFPDISTYCEVRL